MTRRDSFPAEDASMSFDAAEPTSENKIAVLDSRWSQHKPCILFHAQTQPISPKKCNVEIGPQFMSAVLSRFGIGCAGFHVEFSCS